MNRSEFKQIAADLDCQMEKLGFTSKDFGKRGPGGQKSMQIVRAVLHANRGPAHASTLVVGRLVPGAPTKHAIQKVSGYTELKAAEKRSLWSVKVPLATDVQSRLLKSDELISELLRQPQELRAAVADPLADVQWSQKTSQLMADLLGLPSQGATPQSWQRWMAFLATDEILAGKLVVYAKSLLATYGFRDRHCIADLVQETRLQLYLSGLNSARSRAMFQNGDARAEVFTNSARTIMRRIFIRTLLPFHSLHEWNAPLVNASADSGELELSERIARLPQPLRDVVKHKVAGQSKEEIGAILKLDPGHVQGLAKQAARLLGLSEPARDSVCDR